MQASQDEEVFQALKKMLAPYAGKMTVLEDTDVSYQLVTKSPSWKGKPMFFAAVMRKSYVSFHLMPVYWKPELLDDLSPELRKRMQGKACFNFKKMDPALFKQLGALTKQGFDHYKAATLL